MDFHLENPGLQLRNQPQPKGTAFIKTCFNGLNALSGVGILSIPYAVSVGGWLSIITLVLIALLCFYTGLLMKKCMDANPLIKTYPDIGEQAFGNKGRAVISIFIYLELFLLAVEFLILEGDNLHKLFPSFSLHVFGIRVGGKHAFIMITGLIMLPTTWLRRLSLLAYISAGGVIASIVLVGSIFWIGMFDGIGFSERGDVLRLNGLPMAISLYTFCYCGHAVFPTLYTSMRDKSKFPKVLVVCFILSTISYGSMGVLGYMMYGKNSMAQVTLNLPTNKISSKIAIYTTIVNPITKYALILSPIAIALEDVLTLHNSWSISLIIRTSLVASTIIVAVIVPFFGYVMAFIGAFLGISASILFPCLCYLKINKSSLHFGLELIFISVILVMGFFAAMTGTFLSVRDIVKHVAVK